MHYGYTMTTNSLAVCPVFLPEGGEVVGIDGDQMHVQTPRGEQTVRLPFADGGPCSVERFLVDTPGGAAPVFILVPDPRGTRQLQVSVVENRGMFFAVATVGPRQA